MTIELGWHNVEIYQRTLTLGWFRHPKEMKVSLQLTLVNHFSVASIREKMVMKYCDAN